MHAIKKLPSAQVPSLEESLEDWFDLPLARLPDELQARVKRELSALHWDRVSPEQRQTAAYEADFQNDPAHVRLRVNWSEAKYVRFQIAVLTGTNVSTAEELAAKEARLKDLHGKLARLESLMRIATAPTIVEDRYKTNAKKAANARYARPGGYREKKAELLQRWASGNFDTRDVCADQEHDALGVALSTARKWLRNAPSPNSKPTKKQERT